MTRMRLSWLAPLAIVLVAGLGTDARAGAHLHLHLKAHASGKFLVATPPHPIIAPVRLTLHLKHAGKFHTRLVGLGPGHIVFAGVKAKPFKLHVKGPGGHFKVGPGGIKLKGKGGHGFKGKGGRGKGGFKGKF